MIVFEVNQSHYKNIESVLGNMQKNNKMILKKAINATAKTARKKFANTAKEKYALKTAGFNKSMTVKNATVSRLEANILSKGEAIELGKFKASPFRYATGNNRPKEVKAKVLTTSTMKALINGNTKAFVAKFRSGHIAIVERDSNKKMKSDPKKAALRKLLSPSIPQMLGNEKRVYGIIEPEIEEILVQNIRAEVSKIMEARK